MGGTAALAMLALQLVTALEGPALGASGDGPAAGPSSAAADAAADGAAGASDGPPAWLVVRREELRPALAELGPDRPAEEGAQ